MNRHRHSVLITDAGYKHTLGAVRALAKAGFQVDAIGSAKSLSRYSRYLRRVAYDQCRFGEAHLDEFLGFLSRSSYDAILPIGARSVQFIARHIDQVKPHAAIPLPDADTIELCMDKSRMGEFAARHGIAVAKQWQLRTQEDIDRVREEANFPIVIKKRHELDRRSVLYVDAPSRLDTALSAWNTQKGVAQYAPIAQEFVAGQGCGFFALYQNGKLKRAFMHHRVREVPAAGGASCCAESIFEQDILDQGRCLLNALDWHGVAMVEFKRCDKTGQLYLMEINPKFWGSLDLAISAGVDFPSLAVRVAMGEELDVSQDYRVGLRFHWPLGGGELRHLTQRPSSVLRILRDCIDLRVRSNLRLADPWPAARSLMEDIKALSAGR